MQRPDATPTTDDRTALTTALRDAGIPDDWLTTAVRAGRTYRQITDALILRLRASPKGGR